MYKVRASDTAEADLVQIRDYLLNELYNPLAVENLFSAIRRAYATLTVEPYAFEACADPRLRRKGYRKCVVKNYLFIYRVEELSGDEGIVHIVRFFHGSQNYIAQL